jgi:YegS/Rv2252/BmrU family lipid kinase
LIKNIILIGNPIAGGGALKKIKKVVNILEKKGFNVRLMLTAKRGDAELFARQISSEFGVQNLELKDNNNSRLKTHNSELLVIAAGGDGTYNEVANGLIYSNIPMAILPMGTTSVLAREFKIPLTIEKALDTVLNGRIQKVHLGRITCNKSDRSSSFIDANLTISHEPSTISHTVTRHFLLMAGIGFDGEVIFSLNEKIKKYFGKVAHILGAIKSLIKYNPSPITLLSPEHKTESQEITAYTATISKASCYGGNFKITPDAALTEPFFYVFATHKKGRLNTLRYVLGIIIGRHLQFKDISYFKTSKVKIEGDAYIQIDGDYIGKTPAEIDISKDALMLIVPTTKFMNNMG